MTTNATDFLVIFLVLLSNSHFNIFSTVQVNVLLGIEEKEGRSWTESGKMEEEEREGKGRRKRGRR